MCNPMLIVAGVTLAAGAYQAREQRAAGKYEAEVAEQNAKVAGLQAEQAKQTGSIMEDRARMRVRQQLAAQRTAFAAQNVDMSTGTPLDVLGDTAGFGYADAAIERSNALREAWGYEVGATNQRDRGKWAKYSGKAQATGTLLTAGAQASGMWAQSGYTFGKGGGGTKVNGGNKWQA